jgi:hypothetical protein
MKTFISKQRILLNVLAEVDLLPRVFDIWMRAYERDKERLYAVVTLRKIL